MIFSDSDGEDATAPVVSVQGAAEATPPPPPPQNVIRIPYGESILAPCRQDPDKFLDWQVVTLGEDGKEVEVAETDKRTIYNACFPRVIDRLRSVPSGPRWENPLVRVTDLAARVKPPTDFKAAVASTMLKFPDHAFPDHVVSMPDPVTSSVPSGAAAAAPTPVDVVRNAMGGVKGQPKLIAALETIAKASVKQKQRLAAATSDAPKPKKPNRNMIFRGEAGTFKSSGATAFAGAMYKLGLVEKPTVRIVDKRNPMEKARSIEEQVTKTFEKADGGVIFWDEIHQRTDPKFVQAFLAWTDPGGENGGRVVTIIAGYAQNVEKWLELDGGLSRRFPRQNRVEFEKLEPSVLYEFGVDYVQQQGYQLAASAHDAMRACAKIVYDYDPPENAGGMKNAVDAMVGKHDANDEYAPEDVCITATDIFAAVPEARDIELNASDFPTPASAPTVSAPTVSHLGESSTDLSGVEREADETEPLPPLAHPPRTVDSMCDDALSRLRAQKAAAPSPKRSIEEASGTSKKSRGVQDGASSSTAAVVGGNDDSDLEENVPLTLRGKQPAASDDTGSSRKRKRGESSSDVAAPEASNEVNAIVHAIDAFYEVDATADSIPRKDFFEVINEDENYVEVFDGDDLEATINSYNVKMNALLDKALKVIATRNENVTVKVHKHKSGKHVIIGLRSRAV